MRTMSLTVEVPEYFTSHNYSFRVDGSDYSIKKAYVEALRKTKRLYDRTGERFRLKMRITNVHFPRVYR